jgi:hypothetical protein
MATSMLTLITLASAALHHVEISTLNEHEINQSVVSIDDDVK